MQRQKMKKEIPLNDEALLYYFSRFFSLIVQLCHNMLPGCRKSRTCVNQLRHCDVNSIQMIFYFELLRSV